MVVFGNLHDTDDGAMLGVGTECYASQCVEFMSTKTQDGVNCVLEILCQFFVNNKNTCSDRLFLHTAVGKVLRKEINGEHTIFTWKTLSPSKVKKPRPTQRRIFTLH